MKNCWQDGGLVFSQPVRDPLWKNIMLPLEFLPIINSVDFIKLGRIQQLGPASLVYPGATHTRRAHSFGVYYLAHRLLGALSERHKDFELDVIAVRSFLIAALCHDLGHFPFTHSLKELPLIEHEALSARILTGQLADSIHKAGADPALAAAIIDDQFPHTHSQLSFLRSLLSGVLDPDKLDYLNRDAWACGVPYGTQDVDFILQHIGLSDDGQIAIDERGIMSVEAVLFSKYQMYQAVYWHRNVRAATAMIKKAVLADLAAGSLNPEALYGLDDAGFYALLHGRTAYSTSLITSVQQGQLYKIHYEQVFDAQNSTHRSLLDISARRNAEQALSELLSRKGKKLDVVIDIPEPISFESKLLVLENLRTFTDVSTVFGHDLVSSFEQALRIVRVFCDADTLDVQQIQRFMES